MLRRVEKAYLILKKRGLGTGLRDILTLLTGGQGQMNPNWMDELDFLLLPPSSERLEGRADGQTTINWLVPDFGRASGGHINIFRFVSMFEAFGVDQRIYIVGGVGGNPELIRDAARRTYFSINTPFEMLDKPPRLRDADILIASSWETAYQARSISNVRHKYYMVQDREDLFFAEGSFAEFARATYRFGFTGLTAGGWLADGLMKDFGMRCFAFGFSYDRDLYNHQPEQLKRDGPKRVFFYARPGTERRGLELGILALALVAQALPGTQFVFAGVAQQDWNLPFVPEYVGVLRLDQLSELYRSCDAALVLSHTNLSLLPIELMASGCPVVSNRGPQVEWMLNTENCILCDPEPRALAQAMVALLTDDQLRDRLRTAGIEFAQSTDWRLEAERLMNFFRDDLGARP
jgi:O-antigen biosynthesis protein